MAERKEAPEPEAPQYGHLREIVAAALRRVDPAPMLRARVRLEGEALAVGDEAAGGGLRLDLRPFRRILVLGAGKASARMAQALEEILGDRLEGGVLAVKAGATLPLRRIRQVEAGHPVPDEGSVRAGREIAALAAEGDGRTLFVNLISGGGSALLAAPLEGVSLEDKQEVTRLLLACGATIQEINCLRKHLSALKGGRLARRMHPAASLNLILSDVVGDRLDSIASGLTAPDPTTWEEAGDIVRHYGLQERLPPAVREALRAGAEGRLPDTPKADDPAFERVRNVLIGTNRAALEAARGRAEELGYRATVLTSRLTGEAREVARVLYAVGRDRLEGGAAGRPACLLAGGETTVTLRGDGRGGRNQEMALAFLAAMAEESASNGPVPALYFLSAATDGIDGPTDAGGAFAGPQVLRASRAAGLDPRAWLARNDSYGFFDRIGWLRRTGPTHTNVGDIQVLLVP